MKVSFVLCTVLFLANFGLAQERKYSGTLPPSRKTTKARPRGRLADRYRQPTPPTLPPDFTPPTPPKAEKLTPPTPPTPPTAPTVPPLPLPGTQPTVTKKVSSPTSVDQSLQEPSGKEDSLEPTQDPRLTGDPQKDYIYDPNLPRELNNFDLSVYPFYVSVPDDIKFDCAGRHDGYYASIPHSCQLFHYCVVGTRYDFLCANYTVFDQTTFTCRYVNNVNCTDSENHYVRNNALYEPTTTTTLRPPPRRRTKTPPPQEYDDEYYDDDYYDEDEDVTTTTTRRPRRRKPGRKRGGKGRERLVLPRKSNLKATTPISTTTTKKATTTTQKPTEYDEDYEYDEEEEQSQ